MGAAGFSDYPEFLRAVFGAIQKHAEEKGWPPLLWNLGDEPVGDEPRPGRRRNAEAYRAAFPDGPPRFQRPRRASRPTMRAAHTSGSRRRFTSRNLNVHDEASIPPPPRCRRRLGLLQRRQPVERWASTSSKAPRSSTVKVRLSLALERGGPAIPTTRFDWPRGRTNAWCNANPRRADPLRCTSSGRLREGLDDYRHNAHAVEAGGREGRRGRTGADPRPASPPFHLGQRDHDRRSSRSPDWREYRGRLAEAIDRLRSAGDRAAPPR